VVGFDEARGVGNPHSKFHQVIPNGNTQNGGFYVKQEVSKQF